jgi:histone H3/H4
MASPPIDTEQADASSKDIKNGSSPPQPQARATAEREIQQWQNHPGHAIPRIPFQDLVHEITTTIDPTLRMETDAIGLLQQAAESHVVSVIRDGRMITEHEGRVEVRPKDMRLAQLLRSKPFK